MTNHPFRRALKRTVPPLAGALLLCAAMLTAPGATPAQADNRTQAKATPTIEPTADPADERDGDGKRHEHFSEAFSVVIPKGWVWNSGDGFIYITRPKTYQALAVGWTRAQDMPTAESLIASFKRNRKELRAAKSMRGAALTIGGVPAETAELGYTEQGNKWILQLGLLKRFDRSYYVANYILANASEKQRADADAIVDSIELLNRLYGVDRSKSLVQFGGLPEKRTLDPGRATGSAADYTGLLFSGLVRLTPALQVEPDLAESWSVSPDGASYTFTLRAGLTFADGHPLTAADVKYSWERAADPALGGTTAQVYLGDIAGITQIAQGKAKQAAGLRVIDDRTLVVTLDAPKPYALAKLTYPTAFVIDKRDVDKDPDGWFLQPNASGPYRIRRIFEDRAVVFERNEKYFEPVRVPNVVALLNPGGSALSLYESGAVDIVELGYEDAAAIADPKHPLHAQLHTIDAMCTTMLRLDTAQAPTDDVNVRRALAQAINWPEIFKRLKGDPEQLVTTILPAPMPGYLERPSDTPFDARAAKAALAKSAYAGKRLEIVLTLGGQSESTPPLYAAVIDMWQKTLGIKVKVERSGRDSEKAIREKHGNVMPYGWCADYPDPENFLDVLFHSRSANNLIGYANASVDAALERARSEGDVSKRLALYQTAEDAILSEIAAIPIAGGQDYVLVKPHLRGYTVAPIGVKQAHRLSIDGFPE